jgi:hypothetical protein
VSSTIIKDGIGYHVGLKAAFYTDGKVLTGTPPKPIYISSAPWAYWGLDNQEPQEIADDILNTPVLSAAVKATARLAVGKGLDPFLLTNKKADGTEELEYVDDPEVNDWLEDNQHFLYSYNNIRNQVGYGWSATQFVLNKKFDKINRIRATDVATARLEKMDSQGFIPNMYLCGDWRLAPIAYDSNKMRKIPLLRETYELQDLQESSSLSGLAEFGILHRLLENGKLYYPTPAHRSSKAWVKISRSIPTIKNAINQNQMHIKYLIHIAPTYWERVNPEWKSPSYTSQQKLAFMAEKYDDISSFLTGEQNAGKTIISGKYMDPFTKALINDIDIEVIDDKLKDGKMLPDSAAADKQILFSMMFNPAIWGGNLLGDGASGGAGSGSDIREATLVLMMLLNPERMSNLRTLDIVKRFNGWSKRLEIKRDVFAVSNNGSNTAALSKKSINPRLVFRYSSSILTTLDTGKSTAPTTL